MESELMQHSVWFPDKGLVWRHGVVLQAEPGSQDMVVEVTDNRGNAQIVTIPAKGTHPVDPSHLLELDNVCLMNNMHEAPLLDLLRRRFVTQRIYTLTGNVLISINPYAVIPSLYDGALQYLTIGRTKNIVDAQVEDDEFMLAPHVFGVANKALSCMVTSLVDGEAPQADSLEDAAGNQSVVISGESGAGKTENSKYVMSFLIQANQRLTRTSSAPEGGDTPAGGHFTESLLSVLLESSVVLEAFGNAKTVRNDNSSRFGKYIKLMYSPPACPGGTPELVAAVTDTFLLEKSRLVSVGQDERNYHIFYQLVRGLAAKDRAQCEALSLHLPIAQYATLVQGNCSVIRSAEDDVSDFVATEAALRTLHCSAEEVAETWRLLACLLHLSSLQCVDANTVGGTNDEPARITAPTIDMALLASHLGFEASELLRCLTTQELMIMKRSSLHIKVLSSADVTRNVLALVKWMYDRLFAWLVRKINHSHAHLTHDATVRQHARFIGILDIFGFEILGVNSFEQLCINLTNERLQQQFNETVFVSEQEMYRAEGLLWDNITFRDNQHVIDLISGTKAPLGLLLICEEHCMLNRGVPDDNALLSSYDQTHEPIGAAAKAASAYSKPRFKSKGFVVRHFAGEVTYSVDGFLTKNNDAMQEDLLTLLKASRNSFLRNALNVGEADAAGPGFIPTAHSEGAGSALQTEAGVAEETGASGGADAAGRGVRRAAPPKKHASSLTVSQQFRAQLDSLMRTLRRTQPHYIKCVKPNTAKTPSLFEAPLVMEQLRYSGVLEVVRIRREGFPIRMAFRDFYRRYRIFTNGKSKAVFPDPDDCRDDLQARWCCAQIASWVLQADQYQLGHTLIFLRDDGLEVLAVAVRDFLAGKATKVQALYRGHRQLRRYRISLGMIVVCQSVVRRFRCMRLLRRARKAAMCIQWAMLRLVLHRRFLEARKLQRRSAIVIQKVARGLLGRRALELLRAAALHLQLWVSARRRAAQARQRFLLWKFAALKIQLAVRQRQQRAQQGVRGRAAAKVQSLARMRQQRLTFILAKFAAIRIQSILRGRLAKLRFYATVLKVLRIQRALRVAVHRQRRKRTLRGVVRIQALARRRQVERTLLLQTIAAVAIQRKVRGRRCQQRYTVVTQALVRRFLIRHHYLRARGAAVALQRIARGRQTRVQYRHQMYAVVMVQSLARRLVGEKRAQWRLAARAKVLTVLHMWSARRNFLLTVCRIMVAQSVVRRKLAMLKFEEAKYAIVVLQSFARVVLAKKQRAFVSVAVLVVQSVARMAIARERYRWNRFCVTKMQSIVRMRKQVLQYNLLRFTVVTLQSWVRGVLATLRFRKTVGSAIAVTARWRCHRAMKAYKAKRTALFTMQKGARCFLAHLRFKREIMHFHEMLMGEDPEAPDGAAGVGAASRKELQKAISAALRSRPTLTLVRNMWMEYCTALHSAVLGGDAVSLALLRPNYRDLFEVNIKGHSSAHYLAERPSAAILRSAMALLDAYVYSSNKALRGLDADDDDGDGWFNKARESNRISVSLKQTITNSVGKDTLKQGWLKKKRGGMMWQRRYMVLTEDYIIYYKNDQSLNQPKFAIPLSDLSVQRLPGSKELVFEITSPNMPDKKTMFGSSSKKTMSFMADSEQELQEWILPLKAIAGVAENLRPAGADPVVHANLVVRQLWAAQRDRRGNTALHMLASSISGYRPRPEAASARIEEAVRLAAWLIEHGCDVNAQNEQGLTALHILINDFNPSTSLVVGSRELIRCLILKGADGSKVRDEQGNTVLEAINAARQMSKGLRKFFTDLFRISAVADGTGRGGAAPMPHKLKGYSYLSLYVGHVSLPNESHWVDPCLSFSVYNGKGQLIERTQELLNPVLSSIDQDAYIAVEGYAASLAADPAALSRPPGTSLHWGGYWHMQTPLQNVDTASVVLIEIRDGASDSDAAQSYWARYPINFATISTTADEVLPLSAIQHSHSAASKRTMLTAPSPPAGPAGAPKGKGAEVAVDCVLHRRERNVTLEEVISC